MLLGLSEAFLQTPDNTPPLLDLEAAFEIVLNPRFGLKKSLLAEAQYRAVTGTMELSGRGMTFPCPTHVMVRPEQTQVRQRSEQGSSCFGPTMSADLS